MNTEQVEVRLRAAFDAAAEFDTHENADRRRRDATSLVGITAARPRRRSGLGLIAAAVVIALAIAGSVYAAFGGSANARRVLSPATSRPARYVVHDQSRSGVPNPIEVRNAATGALIRTLGSVDEPYPQNGFTLSPDGQTLLYTRLDVAKQVLQIVAVPLAGGRSTILANGTHPSISPDGTQMAFVPEDSSGPSITFLSLMNHGMRSVLVPAGEADLAVTSLHWTSSSAVVATTEVLTPESGMDCPRVASCGNAAPQSGQAFLILTSGPHLTATALPQVQMGGQSWAQLRILGTDPSGILIASGPSQQSVSGAVYAVDPSTGRVLDSNPIPKGYDALAVDRAGQHFLLRAINGDGLASWTRSMPQPIAVGPPALEAAW